MNINEKNEKDGKNNNKNKNELDMEKDSPLKDVRFDDISSNEVITKNLLICGRSGSGKSTIANALIHKHYNDKQPFKTHAGYSSGTTETILQTHSFTVGNITYVLNIVDAVGFFDGKVSNTNTLIRIREIMKTNLQYRLDRIVFVFAYGRYTEEERKSMKVLFDDLGQEIKRISICCITNTEDFTTEKRNKEIENFRNNENTKDIASCMNEIIMVGIKPLDGLEEMFKRAYKSRGDEDANKVRRHILSNSERLKFNEKICSRLDILIEKV